MATQVTPFSVHYPVWYDDQAEFEFSAKGYLPEVEVYLENGLRYRLFFYDPVRLGQDLEAEVGQGRGYLFEPNMVIVPTISRESIQKAVAGLWEGRHFDSFKPIK